MQPIETIAIYKAPQKGKGQKLLKQGFQSVDFPYDPLTQTEIVTLQAPTIELLQRNTTKAIKREY